MKTVKQLAEEANITVRTLHYYDAIGLLRPAKVSESGYRLYDERNVRQLEKILFLKSLGLSLESIDQALKDSASAQHIFEQQREALKMNIQQTKHQLDLLEQLLKGETIMKNLQFQTNAYEEEAKQLYGKRRVEEMMQHLQSKTTIEHEALVNEWHAIFESFVLCMKNEDPQATYEALTNWWTFLNTHFGTYSIDAFRGLGALYQTDPRFEQSIDTYADGLTAWLSEQMIHYEK